MAPSALEFRQSVVGAQLAKRLVAYIYILVLLNLLVCDFVTSILYEVQVYRRSSCIACQII